MTKGTGVGQLPKPSKLTIRMGDATKIDLPDESVDLVMTHPPYFGVSFDRYGGEAKKQINSGSPGQMLKLLRKATKEIYRVLKPGGHFIVANGPIEEISHRYYLDVVDNTKFRHVQTVMQNAYDKNNAYSIMSEFITNDITTWYHFIKGPEAYLNPYQAKLYNNPVWDVPFNNVKDPIDVKLSHRFYIGDVINKEIPRRFINMLTKPGEIVLDPFGGSGIIPITAVEEGRVGICLDISKEQVDAATERALLLFGSEKYSRLVNKND